MAHLTNFSFEFVYEIFTEDASLRLLYHGAKKSKMTKNPNSNLPKHQQNIFSSSRRRFDQDCLGRFKSMAKHETGDSIFFFHFNFDAEKE